jgi:hypothetical protein
MPIFIKAFIIKMIPILLGLFLFYLCLFVSYWCDFVQSNKKPPSGGFLYDAAKYVC